MILWMVLFASAIGFVFYARQAILIAGYFAPDAAEPNALSADGCIAAALVVLAIIALSEPEPYYESRYKRIKNVASWLSHKTDMRGAFQPRAFRRYKSNAIK
jgi:hypothetical protein